MADFTVALSKAQGFEDNDINPQTGSALSWYMQAKSIYPSSVLAQAGIDRLSERIMPVDPVSDSNNMLNRSDESDPFSGE